MKHEISNLVIASVTPIIAYGIYKYYKVDDNTITYSNNDFINRSNNSTILKESCEIACQTEHNLSVPDNLQQSSQENEINNNNNFSPNLSKKNSITNTSSRESSIVDLTELDKENQTHIQHHFNSQIQNKLNKLNNFDEDAHFVDKHIDIKNKSTMFYNLKKWFGS